MKAGTGEKKKDATTRDHDLSADGETSYLRVCIR